ncbi:hypothetical protein [Parendozoicomonas haliclonae]|uniref:hypothetical protein n=1 Tax=Parendozoicomonas haliclonae TaxID=1960125 RepID=UPI0039EFFB55
MNTTLDYLKANIGECRELAVFRDQTSRDVVGIASVDAYRFHWDQQSRTVIFTSNTLIDEAWRGCHMIQKLGLSYLFREKLKNPLTPAFWFFDTYSYKSYLLLPRNFSEYWPKAGMETPQRVQKFIHDLSSHRFGDDWDPEQGIARRCQKKKLKPTVAPITEKHLADPHIAFYFSRNPNYAEGDRLVCLAPLTAKNILSIFTNAFRRIRA